MPNRDQQGIEHEPQTAANESFTPESPSAEHSLEPEDPIAADSQTSEITQESEAEAEPSEDDEEFEEEDLLSESDDEFQAEAQPSEMPQESEAEARSLGRAQVFTPEMKPGYKSGIVALIGRPNAGKSTLLNHLVGEKIAIVSNKPQTTRTRISGILTRDDGQIIFLDTPGIHKPGYKLNRRMMSVVSDALASVDLILLMADATEHMGAGDRFVLNMLKPIQTPTFLILNKVDAMRDKARLLPRIGAYNNEHQFAEVIPISALTGDGVELLVSKALEYLPTGPPLYPEDELTDQPERVIVAELVREKILEATGDELPYVTAVITERWEDAEDLTRINCLIYVERPAHRAIIIGKGGAQLKEIGTRARRDIEKLLDRHVFLSLFVKVREHWRDDERALDELGIQG